MGRLLKYEFRKTLGAKLILLAITFIAEVIFLVGFWANKETPLVIGAALLFMIATTSITLMGILSLVTLHRDMNTKQSYMLFMTPNSCYKILGAKVLECGLSVLLAGAFYFGLGMLDFNILLGKEGNRRIWDIIMEMLRILNIELKVSNIAALIFFLLTSWLSTVTTAYLADVISSSLLYSKKWNLLITFLIFLVLSYITGRISMLANVENDIIMTFVWRGVIALGFSGIMYVITARLMEKYLSV